MRNLSANALAQIATKLGNEPVMIVEVDWVQDVTGSSYADRDVGSIPGRILEVSNLDNVINVSENNSSQELSLVLDDTDGTIKTILNTYDIHKRSARVYQWFEGMEIDDKFLIFAGKISSPITWSERDRSVSFTIISQLEDKEIGFSAEEGDFQWIPNDLIGKTWPMIFGTVQDVPCLQFNKAISGSTLGGVGVVSGQEYHNAAPMGGNSPDTKVQTAQMQAQILHLMAVKRAYWAAFLDTEIKEYYETYEDFDEQIASIRKQISDMRAAKRKQEECARSKRSATVNTSNSPASVGSNPVKILGGEDFPQSKSVRITVNGGVFTGHFRGNLFYISGRLHTDNETKSQISYGNIQSSACKPDPPHAEWDYQTLIPEKDGDGPGYAGAILDREWIKNLVRTQGSVTGTVGTTARASPPRRVANHFWADAGSRVTMSSNEPLTYVVSTIPGTVLAVKAYKSFSNERKLVNVPSGLWYAETKNYGPITAVQVVTTKPLSAIAEQGWEDSLYITFESDIGPHTCDILEYIIDNYTGLSYDETSFTSIRSKLDPFPMNFPILDRKNTLTVLQEIAFQARCALWLSNGVFHIKYLPEDPTSDATITLSDLDAESGVVVELTPTEDLVTKMIVEWRISWAEDDPNKLILRHNVKKYGTQQEEFDFYCFNQPDIILKAATFWLIRKSNTWKKVHFKTYLQMLNLETFDTVTLNFGATYVANEAVKAIIEEATYDSNSQTIDFVCLTPVKSGEMVEYEAFWPSQISPEWLFPTNEEKSAGFAGGDGIGAGASGELPIGFTDLDDWEGGIVWVGGPNIIFRGQADRGDLTPSDIGFVAQSIISTGNFAELTVTANPNPDLTLNYEEPIHLPPLQDLPKGIFIIDLHNTSIVDSENKGEDGNARSAKLSTFFLKVNEDEELVVDTENAKFGNEDDQPEGELFDFKYDDEGEKFGAGTAWLKGSEEEEEGGEGE